MSLLTQLSIKTRLILLCVVPSVVIIAGALAIFNHLSERLESYNSVSYKVANLQHLTDLTHQLYSISNHFRTNNPVDAEITHFDATALSTLKSIQIRANENYGQFGEHHQFHLDIVKNNLADLAKLVSETKALAPDELAPNILLGYDLIYEIIVEVQKNSTYQMPDSVSKLNTSFNQLSWFLYWVEREAWLMQEIRIRKVVDPVLKMDYFQVIARQQNYLAQFLDQDPSGSQLDQMVKFFSQQDYQRAGVVRDKIINGLINPDEMDRYVDGLEKRQMGLNKLFQGYALELSQQINQRITQDRQYIILVFGFMLISLGWLFYFGFTTSYRISSKLESILSTIRLLKEHKQSVDVIPVDGNDEFAHFTANLNHVINEIKCHERDLIRARESAIAANRAKSAFLANMSHEIRTPLNGIIGMTEILSMQGLTSNQRDVVADIDTSSQTLLVIINDILDLSKIESGNLTLAPHSFNLSELIYDTVNLVNANAIAQLNELKIELDHTLPLHVVADDFRIKQILMNLLSNAVKFTKGGLVTTHVSFVPEEMVLRFVVSDTGIGIDNSKLNTIFAPFTQEDDGITRTFGGTGLGLTICKQLIDMMKGRLSVDSQKGAGSRFEVVIPIDLPFDQPVHQKISSHILLVTNGSHYTSAIMQDCLRIGLEVVQVESISYIPMYVDHAKFSSVVYCASPELNGISELVKLRHAFPSVKLVVLQHHLYIDRQLLNVVDVSIALPFLGSRFERIFRELDSRDNSRLDASAGIEGHAIVGAGKKILIVEDNLMNQKIASFFLEKADLAYDVVSNGQEALNIITRGTYYSAILMDCMMPVMDGLTATVKIREWESANGVKPVPIIALTASVLDEDISNCFAAGMNAYLPKPYKSEQLFETFSELNI
jgi:signal transduction histidine kinase/CheY-like chemotaxis protein